MSELATEEKKMVKRRKRVIIEEEVEDKKDPRMYETVTFIFWNDEQRGVPVNYEWVDKYVKYGECKGIFYDGKQYTLPRVAYEYYRDNCSTPKYRDVDQELIPGQMTKASKEVGRTYRFRLELVR